MKTLRFLFLLLPLVVTGQTSRDTVNGWYLWKSEGTGIDSAYSYICDTSAYEGVKSQAFAYSTSGGAIYSFAKDVDTTSTPDRISLWFRLAKMNTTVFSLGTKVQLILYSHNDSLVLPAWGIGFENYRRGSIWESLGWVIDSLKSQLPKITKMVLRFKMDANWLNPAGSCIILIDGMDGLYKKIDVPGYNFVTLDRFGDIKPIRSYKITPRDCDFKSVAPKEVKVDSFRVINTGNIPLEILDVLSTSLYFSVKSPYYFSIEPGDSQTFYVLFNPYTTVGKKSGCIVITHSVGVDTVHVTANVVTDVVGDPNIVPTDFSLSQNYPNPFNPTTKIRFSLPKTHEVTLTVYDLLGREIKVIASGVQAAGTHEETFDASSLPSGTYLCRMQANGFTRVVKMVLMK